MFRKILFWSHLSLGVACSLIILLMSLTGVLLTYERQIIARAERGPWQVKPTAGRAPLLALFPGNGLLASDTITVRSSPTEPIELNLGKKGVFFVDPYNATLLGSPKKSTREFFNQLRAWHRWLSLPAGNRPLGKAITGASTLAFVILILSGLYLWLPRIFSLQHLRPILWFRSGLSGRARDFNWHNTLGFWAALPLFFIALSALPISYAWANGLIYTVTRSEEPKPDSTPPPQGPASLYHLDRAFALAASEPGWQAISFRFGGPTDNFVFNIDRGDGGQPQLKSTLTVDRETLAILRHDRFSQLNTGRRVRLFSRFLHTGESLGLAGQTLAGVASAAAVLLAITGLTLSWRRFTAWRRRG
ncbi:MAG: PepSY-associated TM helix domain-containing protein [Acidobacteriota bacterium]